jgi:CHASE2 domain-containing sensor protein
MSRHRSAKKKHKQHKPDRHGGESSMKESASQQSSNTSTTDSARQLSAPVTQPESAPQSSTAPAAETSPTKRYGPRNALLDFFKGIVFISLVLSIKLMVEHTTFGKQLELMSYNLLQLQLSSRSIPITIVDISELAPEEFNVDGQTGVATSRAALREMVEAIAEHSPKAIGIDIDFAPDEIGYIHPRDEEFFQFCRELGERKGIPVILGVKRTLHKPSAEWLGNKDYEELAASILVPKDSRRMLYLIKIENQPVEGEAEQTTKPGKSMSVALAEAYGHNSNGSGVERRGLHAAMIATLEQLGVIEEFSEKNPVPGLSLEDFLVDYSPLETIETIATIDPAVLRDPNQRQKFQGKIVLLGDAALNQATDTFVVPGRDQPVPGVFLHASAAYTLLKEPLYEVTHRGRILIDVLLSATVLLIIVIIRLYHRNETPHSSIQRWQGLLTLVVVLVAIVGGVLFVRSTRVMWDDFFLALTALLFHPSIEKHVEGTGEWIMKHVRRKPAPVPAAHED